MPDHHQSHACCDVRGLFPERSHYFTGKYMTARDFRDEQRYFVTHHRWHQWTLHGWGIVWGLEVGIDQEAGGACITVHPGMAIDCHGRELVLPYAVRFALADVTAADSEMANLAQNHEPFLLGLEFAVQHRELVPMLVEAPREEAAEEAQRAGERKCNRVREYAGIRVRRLCQRCWPAPQGCHPARLPSWESAREQYSLREHEDPDDCRCPPADLFVRPPCDCEPAGFVPLALLRWRHAEDECGEEDDRHPAAWHASDLGRRYVRGPFYGEALTHIVDINWNHAGATPLDHLREAHALPDGVGEYVPYYRECFEDVGRIILSFDRRLAIPPGYRADQWGNISTYFSQLFALDYLVDFDRADPPGDPLAPRFVLLSHCRRKLYCDFPTRLLGRQKPALIRLSVHCDLILDERGRAVDGDHVGGGLGRVGPDGRRTGNGTEGGTFFSWTRLT